MVVKPKKEDESDEDESEDEVTHRNTLYFMNFRVILLHK